MKLNKRILKDIVKECLVEILAEGLVQDATTPSSKRASLHESIRKTANVSQQRRSKTASERKSKNSKKLGYLDNISFGKDNPVQPDQTKSLNLTKDPVMNEILADTAATTLREQASGESRRSSVPASRKDEAARIVDQAPLEDIFGQSSQNWADLAFAPSIRNK
jgi:hypothetical protein